MPTLQSVNSRYWSSPHRFLWLLLRVCHRSTGAIGSSILNIFGRLNLAQPFYHTSHSKARTVRAGLVADSPFPSLARRSWNLGITRVGPPQLGTS